MLITRASLRHGVGAAHLARYAGRRGNRPAAMAHVMMWSLFGSDRTAEDVREAQDFVSRDEGNGTYIIFSGRPPITDHDFLKVESKPHPPLRSGDRLRFILRGSAVKNGPVTTFGERERGKRSGIIQMALAASNHDGEAQEVATGVVRAWLERQGTEHGFTVVGDHLTLNGWEMVSLSRGRDWPMSFEQFNVSGVLHIGDDPDRMRAALLRGFGRSRGFGCGLMNVGRR